MTAFPILVDPDGPPHGPGVVSLRRHTEADAERVYQQCVDPLSQQFTTVPVPYTPQMARNFATQVMAGGWESDEEWGFAVDVDGRFGGTVSLRNEGQGRAEIAYGAHPDVRGTGAVERALRLLLGWGFDQQKLQAVVWWADRGNWASRRLAWRLGFSFDGTVRRYLPQRGARHDGWVGMLLAGEERSPRNRWLETPRIEGERLRVRGPADHDLERIMEMNNDAETMHWFGGFEERTGPVEAAQSILRQQEIMAVGGGLRLSAADPVDDRLLVGVNLFEIDWRMRSAEVGYIAHPDARGRGLTTEAVRLALRHAFVAEDDGGLGLVRVVAHAGVDNLASRGVLRKAGMTEVGVVRRATRTSAGLVDAVLHEIVTPQG